MNTTKNNVLWYVQHVSTTIFKLQGNHGDFLWRNRGGNNLFIQLFMQRDFCWNQADFHDINDYSKGSDGNSF